MGVYTPQSIGITAPSGGFQQGGWYGGRQYWGGTLGEVNQIHPSSNQQGAGAQVSNEVVAQSAVAQGKTPEQMQAYLESERQKQAIAQPKPAANPTPTGTPGAGTPSGASGTGATLPATTPTLNLPDMYKTLYSSSGITDLEKQLADQDTAFATAQSKINDNPFLSEASRVGRIQKLQTDYNANTKNLRDQVATKKADIETQLNLETKQFDINSQAAQQALSQLNTLLSMGALEGATGEDIAKLTQSTGISSSAIYAAINASKKKDVKTSVSTFTNDAGVVTAVVINAETGEVISKTNLGSIGNAENVTQPKAQTPNEQKASVISSMNSYLGSKDLQAKMSPEDLYSNLIRTYPEAIDYIDSTWTPTRIRIANGEKNPYGK